jgi:hypothetical protein
MKRLFALLVMAVIASTSLSACIVAPRGGPRHGDRYDGYRHDGGHYDNGYRRDNRRGGGYRY